MASETEEIYLEVDMKSIGAKARTVFRIRLGKASRIEIYSNTDGSRIFAAVEDGEILNEYR